MMLQKVVSLGLAVGMLYVQSVSAGIYDDLTAEQKRQIRKGNQVVYVQDVPGTSWPKVYTIQALDATPEEVAAVYADYGIQKNYMPNLTRSDIINVIDARTLDVAYTLHIPIPWMKDENYVTRNSVSTYDNGRSYRVRSTLVRAETARNAEGTLRVEEFGTGSIASVYYYIVPGAHVPGFFKDQIVAQIKENAKAFIRQLEIERIEQRPLLENQIAALRSALASIF